MGEADDRLRSKRVVFVTVGTTCFDSLVRAVDTDEVKEALLKKGYTHLVIQMGRGTYIPSKVCYVCITSIATFNVLLTSISGLGCIHLKQSEKKEIICNCDC